MGVLVGHQSFREEGRKVGRGGSLDGFYERDVLRSDEGFQLSQKFLQGVFLLLLFLLAGHFFHEPGQVFDVELGVLVVPVQFVGFLVAFQGFFQFALAEEAVADVVVALGFQERAGVGGGSLEGCDGFLVFLEAVAGQSGVVVHIWIVRSVHLGVGVFLFRFFKISALVAFVAFGNFAGQNVFIRRIDLDCQ